MTSFFKKEEITATVLVCKKQEYIVDIPYAEYWQNGIDAKFVISFHSRKDMKEFLASFLKTDYFEIGYDKYINCHIKQIWFTNMVHCYATKETNNERVLKEIFGNEIPF